MAALRIEIQRGDDWNGLTTVRINPSGPSDEAAARKRAERLAGRQLSDWRHHFANDRLRLVEVE